MLHTAVVALVLIPVSSMNWDPNYFGMTINPLILDSNIGITIPNLR